MLGGRPLPNVWLGVSVEDQHWADIRIPALLQISASVRFLSCEPLLGPVDLKQAVITMGSERGLHGIDWVIVGGESGPGARPLHPDWARSLRNQTRGGNVPFFFKQWGEHAPEDHGHDHGHRTLVNPQGHSTGPDDVLASQGPVWMRRVGKKQAGRLLDGRHHDAIPARTR